MESVVLGFLKAAWCAVAALIMITVFVYVVRLIKKGVYFLHDFTLLIGGAFCELYRVRSFRGLSDEASAVMLSLTILMSVIIVFFGIISKFGIDRVGYVIPSMAATSISYLILFIYIISREIKIGKEKGTEAVAFVLIFTMVISVISFMSDDLTKSSTLESVGAISTVLALAVGMFALTIAFLNYKRKSGFVVESYFDLIVNKGCYFYFSNLKDRTVVIYDFIIETINLEYYMNLKSPIVVSPYGLEEYKMENICSLFTDSASSEFAEGCLVDSELNEVLSEMKQELLLGNYKIRANTSFGEKYFITKNGGVGMKDSAVTSKKGKIIMHTHFNVDKANKAIKRNDVFKLEKTQASNKKFKTTKLSDSDKESVLSKLRSKEFESITSEDLSRILSAFRDK